MYIAVDFDGTCVTHEFPEIGIDIGAVPVLKKLVEKGHKLILFTMRSHETLNHAVKWFNDNEIKLYAINENPSQWEWTGSPKVYANLYIDDAALGCPLSMERNVCKRPFVNWAVVEEMLKKRGIL